MQQSGNARICFSCTNLRQGDTCEKAISCKDNEVCFTQKYKGEDNTTYYSLGCAYPELCRKDETGTVFGKRSYEHSHVLCHKCCQDNVCNSKLECVDTYNGQSLTCLSCSGLSAPNQCTNTTLCGPDEECFVQKYQSGGSTFYDLGCQRSAACFNRQRTDAFGKRTEVEVHLTCSSCCNGNSLCNRYLDCNHTAQHSYNSSCVFNTECSSNFVCKYGVCGCPSDDYYFGNDACYLFKTINQACLSSLQCKAPLTCQGGVCSCQSNKYWNGTSCVNRKSLSESCNKTDECMDTLYCNHGVCKCDRLDYWTGQKCAERKTFNQTCLSNMDCKHPQICENHRCACNQSFWNVNTCVKNKPFECADLSITISGVYTIYPLPDNSSKQVYCIVKGGLKWTVIQHRFDGTVNFSRSWIEYKMGFGDPHGEHWLGNEYIHAISAKSHHKLYVDLVKNGSNYFAAYSNFLVHDENSKYLLNVTGYSGTAGDSLDRVISGGKANGQMFSTTDRDNDVYGRRNCARDNNSGWWYAACHYANLNKWPGDWFYNLGSSKIESSYMMIVRT